MSEITSWVTHGFRKQGIELNRRLVGVTLALIVLIGLLGAVRLLLVSHVVAAARDLQDTREALSDLQQDNAELEMEIAEMQSMDRLMQRVDEMNLVPVERMLFVNQ